MRKNLSGITAAVLIFALIFCSIADYFSACENVREGVLRLHITANSDSAADQEVKLKVRDRLLEAGADIFDGSVNVSQASQRLTPHLGELEAQADEVLKANGFDYTSKAYITEEYFDTREYEGVTLPAGNYLALRVALGTGEGKNWWCVMFPPLCLPAVTRDEAAEEFALFRGEGENVVRANKNGYAVRFKIVEAAQWVMEKLGLGDYHGNRQK